MVTIINKCLVISNYKSKVTNVYLKHFKHKIIINKIAINIIEIKIIFDELINLNQI